MIKIVTSLVLLFLATTTQLSAQCNNYAAYNAIGVYPEDVTLCDQFTANQDVYIVVTDDTTVTIANIQFSGTIDRVKIQSISNLPNGVNYTCGQPNCEFFPQNGLIKVCVNFNGVVNDAAYGTDVPVFNGDVDYTVNGGGSGTLSGDLDYDFNFTVSPTVTAQCVQLSASSAQKELISIYPNPANAGDNLYLNNLSSIELIDFLGNTIYSGQTNGTLDLAQFNLSSGIYFLKGSGVYGQTMKKIVIR